MVFCICICLSDTQTDPYDEPNKGLARSEIHHTPHTRTNLGVWVGFMASHKFPFFFQKTTQTKNRSRWESTLTPHLKNFKFLPHIHRYNCPLKFLCIRDTDQVSKVRLLHMNKRMSSIISSHQIITWLDLVSFYVLWTTRTTSMVLNPVKTGVWGCEMYFEGFNYTF